MKDNFYKFEYPIWDIMRVDPKPRPVDEELYKKMQSERILRIVALALAFFSVFYFFIKLLFL